MKKGKEPMRTFGDLMQFFGAKTDDKKPPAGQRRKNRVRSVVQPYPMPGGRSGDVARHAGRRECRRHESRIAAARGTACAAAGGTRIAKPGEPSPEPQTPPADEGQ